MLHEAASVSHLGFLTFFIVLDEMTSIQPCFNLHTM